MALRKIDNIEDAWALWQEDLVRNKDGTRWATRNERTEVNSPDHVAFTPAFRNGAYVEVEE